MAAIYEDPELYNRYFHGGDDYDDEPVDWVKDADNWLAQN